MLDVVMDLREGGDWSLDLCFAGLVQNLGPDNVLDMPYRDKHRQWYSVVDPDDEDNCMRPPVVHDWGLERRSLGFVPGIERYRRTQRDALTLIRERQVRRVWLDERMESFAMYRASGFYDAKVPVVVVAGHDRFWNHSPQFVASLYGERLEAMLLDNWYPEYASLPFRTRRIGWSCNFGHYWTPIVPPPRKRIDICFVGYNSHPDRARFIDHIESRWGHLRNHIYLERRPDTTEEFIPKSILFRIMQESKICLNLRGAADRGKTLRAYEIAHVGSFMLSQRIDDPGMMMDFRENVDCTYFSDEAELDIRIQEALDDADMREHYAWSAWMRANTSLSSKQRWADVIGWLQDGGRPVQANL